MRCLFFILFFFSSYVNANDFRAAWVVRHDWSGQAHIDSIISQVEKHAITDLFVQVRGRGDAFYPGAPEPQAAGARQRSQSLATLLRRCREKHIRVHAWVNVFLVGSASQKPFSAQHVLAKYPQWVLRPDSLTSLLDFSVADYRKHNLEGIFIDPTQPGVGQYHLAIIADLLANFPFDGLHLDYFRLPEPRFHAGSNLAMPEVESALYTFLLASGELLRRYRINAILSVAVKPDPQRAKAIYGQNWPQWLKDNLIDYAVPMNYTDDREIFSKRLKLVPALFRPRVVMGIAAYKTDPTQLAAQLSAAAADGFVKVAFFALKHLP